MRRWIRLTNTLLAMFLAVGFAMPAAESGEGSSTQTSGTITLSDSGCVINNIRSGDMDFGSWTWSGSGYQPDSGASSAAVLYVIRGPRDGGCTVTIQTAGLSHKEAGSTSVIGPEHFAVQMVDRDEVPQVVYFNDGVVNVSWTRGRVNPTGVSISLMSVPNDIPPGEYEGEFEFTISAGP